MESLNAFNLDRVSISMANKDLKMNQNKNEYILHTGRLKKVPPLTTQRNEMIKYGDLLRHIC